MGMEAVACLAARVSWFRKVTIRSTLSWTSSAASAESRSVWPAANRDSKTMFWPAIQRRSVSAARNEDHATSSGAGAVPTLRIPTRATFPACCTSAPSGATTTPASEVSRKRRRSIGRTLARYPFYQARLQHPPLKPCVPFSGTRLTDDLSASSMRHTGIAYCAEQPIEAEPPKPVG